MYIDVDLSHIYIYMLGNVLGTVTVEFQRRVRYNSCSWRASALEIHYCTARENQENTLVILELVAEES